MEKQLTFDEIREFKRWLDDRDITVGSYSWNKLINGEIGVDEVYTNCGKLDRLYEEFKKQRETLDEQPIFNWGEVNKIQDIVKQPKVYSSPSEMVNNGYKFSNKKKNKSGVKWMNNRILNIDNSIFENKKNSWFQFIEMSSCVILGLILGFGSIALFALFTGTVSRMLCFGVLGLITISSGAYIMENSLPVWNGAGKILIAFGAITWGIQILIITFGLWYTFCGGGLVFDTNVFTGIWAVIWFIFSLLLAVYLIGSFIMMLLNK